MITIYSIEDCPKCDAAKAACARFGYEFKVIDLSNLVSGAVADDGAMAQLAYQGMKAPVVRVGEHVLTEEGLADLMEGITC